MTQVFVDHFINSGHSDEEGSPGLVHVESSYFKRIAYEDKEIVCHLKQSKVAILNRILPRGGFINTLYELRHDVIVQTKNLASMDLIQLFYCLVESNSLVSPCSTSRS